ncbi:MAG: glycosyltransferase [Elusimicrobiaceae bacterium]|nr:glycosyltransferase [Elusimicrobiaceae bacterium]
MRIGVVPFSSDPLHVVRRWRYDVLIRQARQAGHSAAYYRDGEEYDVVVSSLATENIGVFRRIVRRAIPVIGDITDNLLTFPFSNYIPPGQLYYRLKFAFNGRFRIFEEMLGNSSCIVSGSDVQRELFLPYNHDVARITDAVTPDILDFRARYENTGCCRLAWCGNVSSLHGFRETGNALDRLAAAGSYELVLVTSDYVQGRYLGARPRTVHEFIAGRNIRCRWVPWSYEGMLKELAACDIGIVPADIKDPFVAAKPSGRALLMMGMGLPVVTGPLASYIADIPPGAGFIARTPQDWVSIIGRLAADHELRQAVGRKARETVEAGFSERMFGAKYLEVLKRFEKQL